jgi:SpoVK/Ycf46/Vps4 family AAA+-type ATPase
VPDDEIDALREALRASPANAVVRRLLAEHLLERGRLEEAEQEAKDGLARAPRDARLKLVLAAAYLARGRTGPAAVIVEELVAGHDTPAAAYVLHARLLLAEGEAERAVRQYRRAVEEDPAVRDEALEAHLGLEEEEDGEAEVVEGRVRASREEPADVEPTTERPTTSFADVGGMDKLKAEIRRKIIDPLRHPETYAAYGKKVGGGILLYGPPGCGKTHIARATAGEVSASFIAVGIHEVLDMWIGRSERNLRGIFQRARANRPCVLFFDEVDALGAKRSDLHGASRQVINQFLAEMDGIQGNNDGLLVLAATNAPWHLDPAFRRPGRFDRVLFVPPPDEAARAAILRILLRDKPTHDLDLAQVAKKTPERSGADLKALVDAAVEAKIADSIRTGRPEPLTTKDLLAAAKDVKPTTSEWFGTARNHALYANHGGAYDDVLAYLGER